MPDYSIVKSLCEELEAYIGNYFLSGTSIPDNKIEHYIMMPRLIKTIVWN